MAASIRFGLWTAPFFCLITAIVAFPGLPSRRVANAITRLGCFSDNAGGQRALSATSYAADLMTVESCATFCSKFHFFGVEYARECYCGNNQAVSSTAASDGDCSFACAGNALETCGAGNRVEIYTNNHYSAPHPASLVGIPYAGCFVDSGARVLPQNMISSDNMTAAICALNCAGYLYFGTEWGRECFCGNTPPTNVAPESDCSFRCTGKDTELCGAGMRLNVYGPIASSASTSTSSTSTVSTTSTTTMPMVNAPSDPAKVSNFVYQGCFTDSIGARVLVSKQIFDPSMTLQMCVAACVSYAWFGVEYGSQCFCGVKLETSSIKSAESDCKMPCGGDPGQICGDANRLNVYSNPNIATAAGKNAKQIGPYRYSSCWTDDVRARSLTGKAYQSDVMTVESCAAFCAPFTYFGVEFSRECFCGNAVGGNVATEADCSELCMGDATERCGGPNRLNLYIMGGQGTSSSSTTPVSSSTSTSISISSSSTTSVLVTTSTSSSFSVSSTGSTSTSTSTSISIFPSSTISTKSTTAPPQLTTITSCPLSSTYVGSPTSCWASVPSQCASLNDPHNTGYWAINPAYLCSTAFYDWLPTQISSCFPSNYNTANGQSIYNCITKAPIYCSYGSICATNTYTVGQVPSPTPTLTNIVINGGFESGDLSNWLANTWGGSMQTSITNSRAHTGTYSYSLFFDNTDFFVIYLRQSFQVEPGATYTASLWWFHDNPHANTAVVIQAEPNIPGSDFGASALGAAGGQWNQMTGTFTSPTSYMTLVVSVNGNTNGPLGSVAWQDNFYIDDVVLQKVK